MKYLLLLSFLFISSCTLGNPFGSRETWWIFVPPVETWSNLTWEISNLTWEIIGVSSTLSGAMITQIEWWVITELSKSKLKVTKDSFIKESFQDAISSGATTLDLWNKLTSSINLEEFDKLPEYPATWCPSCSDSPEEYVTLTYGTWTRTIKYNETFDIIPTIKPARKILKDIYENRVSSEWKPEISGIQFIVTMWLSCPNCLDEIKITPDHIVYDKVILTIDNNRDTRPPAPIHFSRSLTSEEWIKFIGWLKEEDFSELSMVPPPPDWEGIRLIVSNNRWEKVYIIFDKASLNPKITELLSRIEAIKQSIRNPGITQIHWSTHPGQDPLCTQSYCSESLDIGTGSVVYTKSSYAPETFPPQVLTGVIKNNLWDELVGQVEPWIFSELLQTPLPPDYPHQTLLIYHGTKIDTYTFNLETHQTNKGKFFFEKLQEIKKQIETPWNTTPLVPSNTGITSIHWWTSFGECAGYCINSLEVKKWSLTFVKMSHNEQGYPTSRELYLITDAQWVRLTDALNLTKFLSLEDRIGCPDCADGGAEWLEVEYAGGKKRSEFDYGKSLPEIDAVLGEIKSLSKQVIPKEK